MAKVYITISKPTFRRGQRDGEKKRKREEKGKGERRRTKGREKEGFLLFPYLKDFYKKLSKIASNM